MSGADSHRVAPILAVAGDPGGAAALAPVLEGLAAAAVPLRLLAYRQALAALGRIGPVAALPESLPADAEAVCTNLLAQHRPALLLCSTSVNAVDWEIRFCAAADALGIPSLAVLDSWSNLLPRFMLDRRPVWPTRVTALDTACRDDLIAAGMPAERIRITGQPALDALRLRPRLAADARQALRAGLGLDDADRLLLFASQPLAAMRQFAGIADPGFDEFVTLDQLIPALADFSIRSGRRLLLQIRPHPREDRAALERYVGNGPLSVRVGNEGDLHDLAEAADLVVGMNSWFLVEASEMGCPVLSFQPGLRGSDPLATNRSGRTHGIYAAAQLEATLDAMLLCRTSTAAQQTAAAVPAVLMQVGEMLGRPYG